MDLSNYAGISNGVVPGNPDGSRLYQSIIAKWENLMPPNKPLAISDRMKIRVWIEQGAPYTVCSDTTGSGGGGGGGSVVKRACFTRDILPVLFQNAPRPVVTMQSVMQAGMFIQVMHHDDNCFSGKSIGESFVSDHFKQRR